MPSTNRISAISALPFALLTGLTLSPLALAVEAVIDVAEVDFDSTILQARGVAPELADFFRQAPRFLPGENIVELLVNGLSRGRGKVRFDSEGNLCTDRAFLKLAGMVLPPSTKNSDPLTCFDLSQTWPQTELTLLPGEERIELVVPQQAIAAEESEQQDNWQHGGFAAMFNYNAQYMDSAGSGVSMMQISSEAGFNLNDWVVRSRQTFSRLNDENNVRHHAVYAQRSFTSIKKVLQIGQISLSNSMFGTGQVIGFQFFPESALQPRPRGGAVVQGVANSQSVVDVRQAGTLLYRTTVPTGPFRLQGFKLVNTHSNLEVTVTSNRGDKQQFTVPASALLPGLLASGRALAPGLSFGAGRLNQENSNENPVVGTIAKGWNLTPTTTLNAGVLGSVLYRAAAIGLDTRLFAGTQFSMQTTFAADSHHDNSGIQGSVSLNNQLSKQFSVYANGSLQSGGYRELSDALQPTDLYANRADRYQIGGGVNWTQETIGTLSLSWGRSAQRGGEHHDYLRGSWNRKFAHFTLLASVEHSAATATSSAENRTYLRANIPLSHGNISSTLNNDKSGTRAGFSYHNRGNKDWGWSLSSDRNFRSRYTSTSGTVNTLTPISRLNASLSRDSNNFTSWSLTASGSAVLHSGGLNFSPHRIGDTFGIAKVGQEKGVRIDTPAGPTWTNYLGYALLPVLSGYKRSVVQMDTRTLAKNKDIINGWQQVEPARGAVSHINFDLVTTRRVLIDVTDEQGNPLPYGAAVFDDQDNFVTVVAANSSVFINDVSNIRQMSVQADGSTICSFTLSLPEKTDVSGLYEIATAVCR
ncbi:fimbria/pilus outer membrane usher protein [Serratia microhaemolytica]|uniref:fimbria/pilus outer membrane usher protein n=1 Tax=Serratia microhaemolytica TaxID=2675110 RepID=UPI000FDD3F48|nr:fimbria/pilus outer membrane usher protein [Serratia microhaemolytica]